MLQRKPSFWDRVPFMRGVAAGAPPLPPGMRDERLDMFRGLALVMIFINHVPDTIYESFTNRNFGFSDAAEAFVFMSGMAAGLAYSGAFRSGGSLWLATVRPWARARQLYFVHITITIIALAIFAAAAHFFDLYELLTKNNIAALFSNPLATMVGLPLLTHQLGYLNILPLYLTLLLVTPALIWAGLKQPHWVLAGSVLLWIIAGELRLNFPNYPNEGGWFFNPFSWQLLFVLGLLCGMAMKQGERFIPASPVLFLIALAWLVIVIVWMKVPVLGHAANRGLGALSGLGVPFYITWFDKTFLSAPRLLHALAVFYVMASLPIMVQFAASKWATPLRLMGRQGLAVFATGTVLSLLLQAIKAVVPPHPLTDGLMLGAGLILLTALAWVLTITADKRRSSSTPRPATSAP